MDDAFRVTGLRDCSAGDGSPADSIATLQEAAEAYVVGLYEDTN